MIVFFVSLSVVTMAVADDQSDVDKVIRESMTEVVKIVNGNDTSDLKKEQLWKIVLKTFDFEKITEYALGVFSSRSKRNLGEYSDKRFSPEQHKEFQALFTEHLGNTYLDRLEFGDDNVTVDMTPAVMLKEKKKMKRARANSLVNGKTPIDYMMLKREDLWRVYDVKVEGRSMVSAFKTEYKPIVMKNGPAYLIDLIKGKIAAHDDAKKKKNSEEKPAN